MRISTPLRVSVTWLETRDEEPIEVMQTFGSEWEARRFMDRLDVPARIGGDV